jgi:hypothetical protein
MIMGKTKLAEANQTDQMLITYPHTPHGSLKKNLELEGTNIINANVFMNKKIIITKMK